MGPFGMPPLLLACLRAVGLSCCLAWPCWAQSPVATALPAVPSLPEALTKLEPSLAHRSQSRYTYFGFDVYLVSLWTAPDFQPEAGENQRLALELNYLRPFAATDIAKRSLQEMRRVRAFSAAQEKQWLSDMEQVFPNVRKGDRLLGLHRPGESAVFWHNGEPRGEIRDPEFARLFFGIWLSPRTSAPALREALLAPP
jgi:hypothetical protein